MSDDWCPENDGAYRMELAARERDTITALRARLEQAERERDEWAEKAMMMPPPTDNTTSVVEAAKALRNAQRAYMSDRGNEDLGKAVGDAAEVLDRALAAQKGSE